MVISSLFLVRKSVWGVCCPSQIKVYSRVLRLNLPYNAARHRGTLTEKNLFEFTIFTNFSAYGKSSNIFCGGLQPQP